MTIRINSKGVVRTAPGLKSYIGKVVNDDIITQIKKDWGCIRVCDSIGYGGHRNITMMGLEKRIDIICTTDNREDIVDDRIAPHEVDWIILDIFEYLSGPKGGKGFY